jgi:hypothetical protein
MDMRPIYSKKGNKYRNLAFQVEGVAKIETMKYGNVSRGTQAPRKTVLARPSNN